MTEVELKKLNRAELLTMLVSTTQRVDELETELATANKRLEDREIDVAEAGTLAEAALKINKVLEAADKAGAQYLENIKKRASGDYAAAAEEMENFEAQVEATQKRCDAMTEETMARCAELEQKTLDKCQEIEKAAKDRCVEMVQAAKEESQGYWDEVYGRIKEYKEAVR